MRCLEMKLGSTRSFNITKALGKTEVRSKVVLPSALPVLKYVEQLGILPGAKCQNPDVHDFLFSAFDIMQHVYGFKVPALWVES